ncbi:molybdate ABC transporter substrate-binding protein [Chelatococcus daeguensis]|uniref:molybdate ABC transporter substrate-binding protein n=1 Tax=Chelatococcus daeguensis TaxID=444444 RepID=UPI001FDA902A|nr:molybdate ABC transporter substrate-binding protein [Chelatococcus daeguensis]
MRGLRAAMPSARCFRGSRFFRVSLSAGSFAAPLLSLSISSTAGLTHERERPVVDQNPPPRSSCKAVDPDYARNLGGFADLCRRTLRRWIFPAVPPWQVALPLDIVHRIYRSDVFMTAHAWTRRPLLALGLVAGAMIAGLAIPTTRAAAQQAPAPVIAAAADLKFAVTEIAAAFKADTGKEVKLSFGSTGNFATQIREGAPFQLFMAADEKFIRDLHKDGFTRDEGDLYAEGRIVLMVPHGSLLKPDAAMDDLAAQLAAGRITRFAIANPEHAPYGLRAEEALKHRGLWEKVRPHLVLGENVSQAAQFALSGNAEGGIIAYSLALAPEVRSQGTFALIPHDWHEPLLQRMALLKSAGPVAEQFYAYLKTSKARDIMKSFGFVLPDEG